MGNHNSTPAATTKKPFKPSLMRGRSPITQDHVVTVEGRYLYVGEERFFVKGIAFPNPPPIQIRHTGIGADVSSEQDDQIDLEGWNAVLEQLANETDINTVRMYEMDCHLDYSHFLKRAAELGVYVIVPFTSVRGPGVLSRDKLPPYCYRSKLFTYGTTCLEQYWHHPNVLAGVVGNEVMNNLLAWQSAPCVKSYLDDLQAFAHDYGQVQAKNNKNKRRSFPFMYATQHDSPSAELLPDEATKITLDYLSCTTTTTGFGGSDDPNNNNFIFGINIESWCSSLQSFEYEEDGVTESSYHILHDTLLGLNKTRIKKDAVTGNATLVEIPQICPQPIAVPVMFSEMGCPRDLFNHDNSIQPKYVRDWKQIPLLLPTTSDDNKSSTMSDLFSGFVAYGYDGGGFPKFRMMGGEEKWDGIHVLPSSPDYENFRQQLSLAVEQQSRSSSSSSSIKSNNHDFVLEEEYLNFESCDKTIATLKDAWGLILYPLSDMPSYYTKHPKLPSATKLSSEIAPPDWMAVTAVTTIEKSHLVGIRAGSTSVAEAWIFLWISMTALLTISAMGYLRRRRLQRWYNFETPRSDSSEATESMGLVLPTRSSHHQQTKPKSYNSISSGS